AVAYRRHSRQRDGDLHGVDSLEPRWRWRWRRLRRQPTEPEYRLPLVLRRVARALGQQGHGQLVDGSEASAIFGGGESSDVAVLPTGRGMGIDGRDRREVTRRHEKPRGPVDDGFARTDVWRSALGDARDRRQHAPHRHDPRSYAEDELEWHDVEENP